MPISSISPASAAGTHSLRSRAIAGLLALGTAASLPCPAVHAQDAAFSQRTPVEETYLTLPDAPGRAPSPGAALAGDSSGPVTLKGLPVRFLKDELGIVTSPARISTGDLKWLLPLAGAAGASLGTDTYTMRNVVSRNASFNDAANTSSDVLLGSTIGVPALLFGLGQLRSDEHQRETGLLAGEAAIDAYVLDLAVKYATLRERPNQNDARGHFFVGNASSSPSFVSGHSIVAWSSAAVLAGEYNRPWQQVGIYTLASGVSLTRVLAQQHFPTDALLGSAAGWLIGHYVYRRHHRPLLVTTTRKH